MKQTNNASPVWKVLSGVFFLLLAGSVGWALVRLRTLAVLPGKYFWILAAAAALVVVLLGILMFPKVGRHQKSKGRVRRVIAYLLAAVISVGAGFGGMALGKLNQTFDTITKAPEISAFVGIYVRKDDPAQTLEDASAYTLAVTDAYDAENSRATVKALETLWNGPVQTRMCASVFEMIDALYDDEVQGLILNEAYLDILSGIDGYSDFEERTRQLYQHAVQMADLPTTLPQPTEPTELPVETTEPEDPMYKPFIVYLSGADTRSPTLVGYTTRSDVNILAAVNPETRQILLVSTPRDYYVPNPAFGGANDKLTHCGLNGPENSAKALADLYGITVDYTARINFTGFETLIDSIGGIDVYSDFDDGVWLRVGNNHMDGERALIFARDRYDYSDGDNARGRHQMQVIKAVVDKMISGSMITHYSEILDSLQGMFTTSMPSERISELIQMQLEDMRMWDVQSFAVTGTGGHDIPAAMAPLYAYVMYPHEKVVQQASELIGRVLVDDILTAQDLKIQN